MRLFSRFHVLVYQATGGRIGGHTIDGLPVLLLTTRGRRTGEPRTTPLVFHRKGDRVVVCGGSGGTERDPGWDVNLRAHPTVEVRMGGRCRSCRARELEGAEREATWREMAAAVPRIEEYRRRVGRTIPLVALEPESGRVA